MKIVVSVLWFVLMFCCIGACVATGWLPDGISCDSEGNLYVVDHIGHVRMLTTEGRLRGGWPLPKQYWNNELPWDKGSLDICVGPEDNVYVMSPCPGHIMKFSPKGELLVAFMARDLPDGRCPNEYTIRDFDFSSKVLDVVLEVNEHGIYFLDYWAKNISHFSLAGELISRHKINVRTEGFSLQPEGFIVDSDGEILILESGELFDLEGVTRGKLPAEESGYRIVDGNEVYVLIRPTSAPSNIVKRYRDCELLQEWGPTWVGGPCKRDVASDSLGNIYFISNCFSEIVKFSPDRVEHWDAWGHVTFSTPCALNRPWDVNRDGRVDILDLILVSKHYGEQIGADWEEGYIPDVSFDGDVDKWDLDIVLSHFGDIYVASAPAKIVEGASQVFQNYPNPFNPETWIPYQLREGNEVTIQIHSVGGELVRALKLGYKPGGLYTSKNEAAYWDGKDETGTLVASGVYFYTIQAGHFSQTRKMIVVK